MTVQNAKSIIEAVVSKPALARLITARLKILMNALVTSELNESQRADLDAYERLALFGEP